MHLHNRLLVSVSNGAVSVVCTASVAFHTP